MSSGKEPSHGAPCPSCFNNNITDNGKVRIRKYNEYPCSDCSVIGWPHFLPRAFIENNPRNSIKKIKPEKTHFHFTTE